MYMNRTLTNCRRKFWSCSVWDPERKGCALSAAEKALGGD